MWHFKEEREKRRKIREKEGTKKEKKRRRRGRGREEKDWEMVMGVEGNAAARRRCRWLQRCPGSYLYFIGIGGRRQDSWQLPKLSYSILRPNKRSDSIVWSLRCRVPPRLMPGGLYSTAGFSTVLLARRPFLPLFCFARFAYFPHQFCPPRRFRVQCLRPLGRPIRAIAILSRAACPTQQLSLKYVLPLGAVINLSVARADCISDEALLKHCSSR